MGFFGRRCRVPRIGFCEGDRLRREGSRRPETVYPPCPPTDSVRLQPEYPKPSPELLPSRLEEVEQIGIRAQMGPPDEAIDCVLDYTAQFAIELVARIVVGEKP
jgi:hypothetical protein